MNYFFQSKLVLYLKINTFIFEMVFFTFMTASYIGVETKYIIDE